MASDATIELPPFYSYPPYFTLQPVLETRQRQIQLWKDLILRHCQQQRTFLIDVPSFPLFHNEAIQRKLTYEARVVFLNSLALEGRAEWVDKQHQRCWVFWRTPEEWANLLSEFVNSNGLADTVMTVDELCTGDETKGTDLAGLHPTLMQRVLKILEGRGKAVLFQGATADEEGVKFLS